MNDLKLYVWTDFCPDYSPGLAFAIANTLEEAKAMVIKQMEYPPPSESWGDLTIHNLDAPVCRAVAGGG